MKTKKTARLMEQHEDKEDCYYEPTTSGLVPHCTLLSGHWGGGFTTYWEVRTQQHCCYCKAHLGKARRNRLHPPTNLNATYSGLSAVACANTDSISGVKRSKR
jgi:hypothetical protein